MKKILSIILALIMLLSVMPVAYAAENSLKEAYIEKFIKFTVYNNNVYEPKEIDDEINTIWWKYFPSATHDMFSDIEWESCAFLNSEWLDLNEDKIPALTEVIEIMLAETEALLEESGAVRIVDCSSLIKSEFDVVYYCKLEKISSIADINEYKQDLMSQLLDVCRTQAEFDAVAEKLMKINEAVLNHYEGGHNCEVYENMGDGTHKSECWLCKETVISAHAYGEYISNNDATEEADGTKTAACEFCGATDTVTDEGSQLVKEPASFIDRIIEFFRNLINKILSIFK